MAESPESTDSESSIGKEGMQNLYEQMYNLYLEDKLTEEGIDKSQMNKAQIVFKRPFKSGQFSDLDGGESDVCVRINDDVQAVIPVQFDSDQDFDAGDPVPMSEIDGFKGTISVPDFGADVGNVTFIWLPDGTMLTSFDFIYNESYLPALLDAADEFIDLAAIAHEKELWRGFVENAFHAAERMMKMRVIQHGEPAYDHSLVQSNYRKWAKSENGDPALWDAYNQLKDKYRFPGSYADPGNYPKNINEKDFELDKIEAANILSVIRDHRDTFSSDDA